MSDDLVKRLRATCSCNIDNTPCLAEEECRVAQEAADRIEELEAQLAKTVDLIAELAAGPSWGESVMGWVNSMVIKARTTLAELKGKTNDQR